MHSIYIDIETLPDLREGAREQYIEAARGNVKAPSGSTKESLAADLGITDKSDIKFATRASLEARWVEEVGPSRAEPEGDAQWRKTAFDGARGQICCIGIAVEDGPVEVFHGDERDLLTRFHAYLGDAWRENSGHLRPVIVGHNIVNFDIRFIYHRSIILGIRPPIWFPANARPWDDGVYDTMTQWAGHGNRISLDDLAKALGIEGKDGMDGSMVYDMWAAGKMNEIADYCKSDVEITRRIFKRMNFLEPQ